MSYVISFNSNRSDDWMINNRGATLLLNAVYEQPDLEPDVREALEMSDLVYGLCLETQPRELALRICAAFRFGLNSLVSDESIGEGYREHTRELEEKIRRFEADG